MERYEDRLVLAIECGHSLQISGIPFYNGALYIVRCGICGPVFPAAQELMRQYHIYTHRLDNYEALGQALKDARAAMTTAIEQWGREAGKDALSRALSAGCVGSPEARTVG